MATNLASSLKGCRSWDDLQKRWKDCEKKTKGDLFEALVKNYLLLTPEFASKFKAVWGFKEIPSSVFQKLKLPSSDKGIDLVAETKEGDYWAIQCKYREDSSDQITWREISTFMGLYLGRKQISFGLIASTTERITKVLKDHDKVGFLAYDVWQGLDEEFFKRLQARLHKKIELLKARLPRPHQKEAVRDAVAYFKKKGNSRGKLIMPCGTGKSLTSFFIAQKLKARKVLIAVPSLALIKQTLKEWMRESMARGQNVEWICVCSDKSAGKVEQDEIAVLTQDLGVPCHTDLHTITDWLRKKHQSPTIVFSTYQSGDVLSKAARKAGFSFDLGIMDEAHKTTGTKDKPFSHLLQERNICIRRRLFMTATERRYRGRSDEILSMDDPSTYGKTIHELSFKRALEYSPPILSDYKLLTIHISKDEVADLVRNRAFVRPKGWSKETESATLMALAAFRNAIQRYPIRHAVSFHRIVARAASFAACNEAYTRSFPKGRGMITRHVSSKIPAGTRARIVAEFSKANIALITNARCLTEGVDIPNIDAVLFADPRKSLIDIVQAIGRALRPSLGKKIGYVIVPVFHERNATMDEVIESSSFKEVLQTIRALGSHDNRIIEFFRAISRGQKPRKGSPIDIVLGERLAQKINLKEFAEKIHLRSWDRLAKLSWMPFNEARIFVHRLNLKSNGDWKKYIYGKIIGLPPLPPDIPKTPRIVYEKEGWKNLGDWLGTGRIHTHRRKYWPFREARAFMRTKKLKNNSQYHEFLKKEYSGFEYYNKPLPSAPDIVYKQNGWGGWGDFLGSGYVANYNRQFRSFKSSRQYARRLGLGSYAKWKQFCDSERLPKNIPKAPDQVYKEWVSWPDWLGTGRFSRRANRWMPFKEAHEFVAKLNLKNKTQFIQWCKGQLLDKPPKPVNFPSNPYHAFRGKGFTTMPEFLGTGYVHPSWIKFYSYKDAKARVSSLGLKTIADFDKWKRGNLPKMPAFDKRIPRAPYPYYLSKGEKFQWNEFLGCSADKKT